MCFSVNRMKMICTNGIISLSGTPIDYNVNNNLCPSSRLVIKFLQIVRRKPKNGTVTFMEEKLGR